MNSHFLEVFDIWYWFYYFYPWLFELKIGMPVILALGYVDINFSFLTLFRF